MNEQKRQYQNGDRVLAGFKKLEMVVVSASLCVKGWRYEMASPKKDGTPHKTKQHRFFFSDNLCADPNFTKD